MSSPAARTSNINIRVAPDRLAMIDRAAGVVGKTRSEFILDHATQAAEEALLDRRYFALGPKAWDRFVTALDARPKADPRLARLLSRRPPWQQS